MQDGLVAGTLGIPAGRAGRHASGRGLEVVRYNGENQPEVSSRSKATPYMGKPSGFRLSNGSSPAKTEI
jgi:hypothetical protein